MQYRYTIPTPAMWANFDGGILEADDAEKALTMAKAILKDSFKKANEAFAHFDNTKDFLIEFDKDQIEIKLIH